MRFHKFFPFYSQTLEVRSFLSESKLKYETFHSQKDSMSYWMKPQWKNFPFLELTKTYRFFVLKFQFEINRHSIPSTNEQKPEIHLCYEYFHLNSCRRPTNCPHPHVLTETEHKQILAELTDLDLRVLSQVFSIFCQSKVRRKKIEPQQIFFFFFPRTFLRNIFTSIWRRNQRISLTLSNRRVRILVRPFSPKQNRGDRQVSFGRMIPTVGNSFERIIFSWLYSFRVFSRESRSSSLVAAKTDRKTFHWNYFHQRKKILRWTHKSTWNSSRFPFRDYSFSRRSK